MLTAEQALAETISMGPIRTAAFRREADELLGKIQVEIERAIESEQTKTEVSVYEPRYYRALAYSQEAIDLAELDLIDLGYHIDHGETTLNHGGGYLETFFSHIVVSWGYN